MGFSNGMYDFKWTLTAKNDFDIILKPPLEKTIIHSWYTIYVLWSIIICL